MNAASQPIAATPPPTRLVAMCGSAAPTSANAAALDLAATALGAGRVAVSRSIPLDTVPAFRADLVDDPPSTVAGLRAQLEACDGVLLAAPEYAAGVAGSTKNALDWMVGSASLYRRPVAVLSAGSTGGGYAIEQLVRTLTWQGAYVVATLGIAAPRTKMAGSGYVDPGTVDAIERWAADLVAAASGPPAERFERAVELVARYGIDPARLGDTPGPA